MLKTQILEMKRATIQRKWQGHITERDFTLPQALIHQRPHLGRIDRLLQTIGRLQDRWQGTGIKSLQHKPSGPDFTRTTSRFQYFADTFAGRFRREINGDPACRNRPVGIGPQDRLRIGVGHRDLAAENARTLARGHGKPPGQLAAHEGTGNVIKRKAARIMRELGRNARDRPEGAGLRSSPLSGQAKP